MHLNDGQLRAMLDNALPAAERAMLTEHLAQCDECGRRAEEFAARGARVTASLSNLTAAAPDPQTSAQARAALERFHARYDTRKENSVFNRIFSRQTRPLWAFATAVVLLIASMSFAPVRAWAGQFLELFRVQKVQVLSVDSTLLNDMTGESALAKQVSQLLSQSVTVTKKPVKPQLVSSVAQANQKAGFPVRVPASRSDTPELIVTSGSAFQFVVDRKLAQEVLDQAGRSDLQLPTSLDGATIKVDIPAGVTAGYGDCPQPDQLDEGEKSSGSRGRRYANCVVLEQMPSPTVDTPPDLDVQKLAELGLQFSGMKQEQAHAYAQTVDWTSTLVIPIPRNAAQYKPVQVDGVTGYLIQRPLDDAPQYALVWVKNGIVYAIGGLGTDTDAAIQMANSLK